MTGSRPSRRSKERHPVGRYESAKPGFGQRDYPAVQADHLNILKLPPDALDDITTDGFVAGIRPYFSKHGFGQPYRRIESSRRRSQIDRSHPSGALRLVEQGNELLPHALA